MRFMLVVLGTIVLTNQCNALSTSYLVTPIGPSNQEALLNKKGDILLTLVAEENQPSLLRILPNSQIEDFSMVFPEGAVQNNQGVLVGLSTGVNDEKVLKRWQGGEIQYTDLLANPIEGIVGINDAEDYIGISLSGPGATSYLGNASSSEVVSIGDLGDPTTVAFDINENGFVVGSSRTGATPIQIAAGATFQEAFVYENGLISGIGTFGGISSAGTGINASSQIVGETTTHISGDSRAFVYDSTLGMQLLALAGRSSYANDINDLGDVIGTVIDDEGTFHVFVGSYDQEAMLLQDLDVSGKGWTVLSRAGSINSNGQIVGIGILNGQSRAFLATPVPEPSTFALLSMFGIFFVRSKRKHIA